MRTRRCAFGSWARNTNTVSDRFISRAARCMISSLSPVASVNTATTGGNRFVVEIWTPATPGTLGAPIEDSGASLMVAAVVRANAAPSASTTATAIVNEPSSA